MPLALLCAQIMHHLTSKWRWTLVRWTVNRAFGTVLRGPFMFQTALKFYPGIRFFSLQFQAQHLVAIVGCSCMHEAVWISVCVFVCVISVFFQYILSALNSVSGQNSLRPLVIVFIQSGTFGSVAKSDNKSFKQHRRIWEQYVFVCMRAHTHILIHTRNRCVAIWRDCWICTGCRWFHTHTLKIFATASDDE